VLADITCDSDGKIDKFVHPRLTKRTLEVHELNPGEPYYLAAFLVGAYQETLGDLHNLFGDTHVVHIRLQEAAAGGSRKSSKAIPPTKCSSTWSTTPTSCIRASPGTASELNGYAYLEVE
jgi:hypothetical protein